MGIGGILNFIMDFLVEIKRKKSKKLDKAIKVKDQ